MEGTFCFIDMAGFTALTEAHGDETAADLVDRFVALIETSIRPTGARLVATIGDGAFMVAPRPEDGIRFVERLFALSAEEPNFPALRVGLHHGEALERNGTYFGASVNLAARVAAQARGSQVIATAIVAEAARQQGFGVESVGTFSLRNVRGSLELFALSVLASDQGWVVDPVCRMNLQPDGAAGRLRHLGKDYWFCSLDCVAAFAADPAAFAVGGT